MSEEENKAKEEQSIEEPILEILENLKGFQGILDSENIKLDKKTLREWAGHINYCFILLIEQFQELRQKIFSMLDEVELSEEELKKLNKPYEKFYS